jgi:hypothetical protein
MNSPCFILTSPPGTGSSSKIFWRTVSQALTQRRKGAENFNCFSRVNAHLRRETAGVILPRRGAVEEIGNRQQNRFGKPGRLFPLPKSPSRHFAIFDLRFSIDESGHPASRLCAFALNFCSESLSENRNLAFLPHPHAHPHRQLWQVF